MYHCLGYPNIWCIHTWIMHNNIKSWSSGLFGSMLSTHTIAEIQSGNDGNVDPWMACYSSYFLQIVIKLKIKKIATM